MKGGPATADATAPTPPRFSLYILITQELPNGRQLSSDIKGHQIVSAVGYRGYDVLECQYFNLWM